MKFRGKLGAKKKSEIEALEIAKVRKLYRCRCLARLAKNQKSSERVHQILQCIAKKGLNTTAGKFPATLKKIAARNSRQKVKSR